MICGKPFCEIPQIFTDGTCDRLVNLQSTSPFVSIVFSAFNEDNCLTACFWSSSKLKIIIPIGILGVTNNFKDRIEELCNLLGNTYYNDIKHCSDNARQCRLKDNFFDTDYALKFRIFSNVFQMNVQRIKRKSYRNMLHNINIG